MAHHKSLYLIIFLMVFAYNNLSGQSVGVVLSGGGAKGVAHVGVLKALEDNHVPIDYITGTSMGAIIGGLYASGYSPEEIDSLINSDNFLQWAKGEVEEEYTYLYMKEEPNSSWISLALKYDSLIRKPEFPSSIIQPFQMDFAFMQIFSEATTASKRDFDNLFVPFRCIASDIENNKAVTLSEGNLGKAIRASMTYPFYFKPITIDGKIMLDGGMYNNFPSDVMLEEFFPDMIIGSNVAGNYSSADPSDLVSQIRTIMMEQTQYDVYCESSVLIEPQVPKNTSILDFSRRKAFIDSGYVATERKINEIRLFLTDSVFPDELRQKRENFKKKSPPLVFNNIEISGLENNEANFVNRMLLHDKDTVGIKMIKEDYFRVLANEHIQYIYPEANYDEESGYYHLDLEVKKDKNIEVQFGGTVSSAPINEAFLQLKYKFLGNQAGNIRLNTYIGRFYSSVSAKGRLDFSGKSPFYIKGGTTYNQWDYFKTSTTFFEDKTPSYLIKNDFRNTVTFGAPVSSKSKLEASISAGNITNRYYQSNQFSRLDTTDKTEFMNYNTEFTYQYNTLNRKQFATKGKFIKAEVKNFRGEATYTPGSIAPNKQTVKKLHQWLQVSFQYKDYLKSSSWFTFGYDVDLFLSNRSLFENQTSSLLMAHEYTPVPESKTVFLRNFNANNYAGVGVKGIFKLAEDFNFRNEIYTFQPFREILSTGENNQAYLGPYFDKHYFIGSSRLVYHSPLGPISLYLNYYQGHNNPLAFGLNIGYIIFNEHTLH
ncbi:MAG: patatin-like phospholipase family protein [Bacteroidales bacterium]|nr:patatin-like phospholipase family protein [Bacteroidales bacterium]MCF8327300.1 patatin-like phospholipase family protein [Bacteroidales bacterium]